MGDLSSIAGSGPHFGGQSLADRLGLWSLGVEELLRRAIKWEANYLENGLSTSRQMAEHYFHEALKLEERRGF